MDIENFLFIFLESLVNTHTIYKIHLNNMSYKCFK